VTDHSGRCTDPQNPALHEALGTYVLGALGPEETDRVAAHLARCRSCREEYLELLEVLPLLAAVTETEALYGPVQPGPEILDRVLAARPRNPAAPQRDPADHAHSEHGRPPRRSRRKYALAAAGLVLVAAVGTITFRLPTQQPSVQTAWTATATSKPGSADPDAWAAASVRVTATTWGSAISLTIQHVPRGYECTMIVVADDGHREPAGTWKAPNSGTITIPGTAGIDPDEIASIQIQLPSGRILVTLNRP
jgi:hypothetical protein